MKSKIYIILTLVISIYINGCIAVYNEQNKSGEPAATTDASPPINYSPTFIQNLTKYDAQIHNSPKFEVTSVDVRELTNTKIKVHLLDENNNYLTGVSPNLLKKMWCEVIDEYNGKPEVVKDFKVYEVAQSNNKQTAIAIVMDHSGSMGDERAIVVQKAIENIVQNKSDKDIMALIRYDSKVILESPFSFNKNEILNNHKINGLQGYGGLTAITNAIDLASKKLAELPRNYEKAIVVFTDGWDNSSTIAQEDVIKFARANNIIICGVDFGENVNSSFMKNFSDSTSGFYKKIYRTNEFPLVFNDIYNRIKNYYVLEFKTKKLGLHNIKLKLCLPKDSAIAYTSFDNTPDIGSIGLINVYFDLNKATITKNSESAINDVISLMELFPNIKIQIEGHTDSLNATKDIDYNKKLSQKRADAVKEYIIKKGIPSNRITTMGYGEMYPIATNETEEGRAINRRTEFVIIAK